MDQRLTPNQPGIREQLRDWMRANHIRIRQSGRWLIARIYCELVGHEVRTVIIKNLRGRYVGTDCECPRCGKIFHKQRKEFQ